MSDYRPLLSILNSNTTRAGMPFDPAPACMVTDFFGNLAPDDNYLIGLSIRDSDQDEFDPKLAKEKFASTKQDGTYVGWPPGSLNPYPIGDFVDVKFSTSQYEVENTRDDIRGCSPSGQPTDGCLDLSSDTFAVIKRDKVSTPEWCPATNEKRYCRSCLTAERYFESFNETFLDLSPSNPRTLTPSPSPSPSPSPNLIAFLAPALTIPFSCR